MAFTSSLAEARVFNIDNESVASFFKVSYGAPSIINTTYSDSTGIVGGTAVTLDNNKLASINGGEFGFVYSTKPFSIRFAIEMLLPTTATVVGSDSNGNVYTLTSTMQFVIPKVVAEFHLKQAANARWYLGLGYGSSSMTLKNTYAMTAQGTTDLGVADFAEELKSSAPVYEASVNYESLLSDTTTYVLEAGYRQGQYTSINFTKDVTNFQGAQTSGGVSKTNTGVARTFDLPQYFVGLSFRFWL